MIGTIRDGDLKFDRGLDSASALDALPSTSYAWGVNILNRGGAVQCRPGFDWMFTLPPGNFQGLTRFYPIIGKPVLVAFVAGTGYMSQYPYRTFTQIQGATLSTDAQMVFTTQCVQSVTNNADGSLKLIKPRQLLVCQDGVNPPVYFDGRILTALTGVGSVPQGTHVAWAGSRLWVAQKNLLFASDLSNPLSFLEETYNTLGGVDYFTLPDVCTGLAAMPGTPDVNSPLMAFTKTTTSMFQSNILNRTLWPTTTNFQADVFPTVGCVAPRSIVSVAGLLWWFSAIGQTRMDAAQSSALTSQIYRIDREMARSSYFLGDDLHGVCGASYENFILTSVPSAAPQNKHTWVYDGSADNLSSQNAVSYVTTSWSTVWASIWTGIQPIEWTSISLNGSNRLFAGSVDLDGNNRVYEAFSDERRDSGCDIPWAFESRAYNGNTMERKQFRFLEYGLSELQGEVNLKISWAGASRGEWKTISSPTFYAEEGSLNATTELSANTQIFALKKQSRVAATQDVRDMAEDKFSSAGIEGLVETVEPDKEAIDTAFQIRIEGSGPCAIRSLQLFLDPVAPRDYGSVSEIETPGTHFVQFDGAASNSLGALEAEVMTVFPATVEAQAVWHNFAGLGSATVRSTLSAEDAIKRATQASRARAQNMLEEICVPAVWAVSSS